MTYNTALLASGPIRTHRTFEEICQQIRHLIAAGSLKPGQKLPPERVLAQQLGVSRNVLREALHGLEMVGVLRLTKGMKGGAFVCEGDLECMRPVMVDMLTLGAFSADELAGARAEVISLLVRLACKRGKKVDFDAVEMAVSKIATTAQLGSNTAFNREFYSALGAATGNRVLTMLVHAVTAQRSAEARMSATADLQKASALFLTALRARDATKAVAAMRTRLVPILLPEIDA